MKTIICASCANTFKLEGDVKSRIFFPNRMVYLNGDIVRCPKCTTFHDVIIKGENYIGAIRLGYDVYLSNKEITESNIQYYKNQIALPANQINKVYNSDLKETITKSKSYELDLERYLEQISIYNSKENGN